MKRTSVQAAPRPPPPPAAASPNKKVLTTTTIIDSIANLGYSSVHCLPGRRGDRQPAMQAGTQEQTQASRVHCLNSWMSSACALKCPLFILRRPMPPPLPPHRILASRLKHYPRGMINPTLIVPHRRSQGGSRCTPV